MIKTLVSTSSDELTASSVLTFALSGGLGLMIHASKYGGVSAPKPEGNFPLIQHSLAQNAATISLYIGLICIICMLICFLVFIIHGVSPSLKQPGAQPLSGTKTRIAMVTMYASSYITMMASISTGICFLILRI